MINILATVERLKTSRKNKIKKYKTLHEKCAAKVGLVRRKYIVKWCWLLVGKNNLIRILFG